MLLAGTNPYDVMSADAPNVSFSEPTFAKCSAAGDPNDTDVQSRGSVMCTAPVDTFCMVSILGY